MKRPGFCAPFIVIVASVIMVSCSTTESTDVATSGISADIKVYSYGQGTSTVEATLYVGDGVGGTRLEVVSPDSLTANVNGTEKTLKKKSSILNDIYYQTSFDTDSVNVEFLVSFSREEQTSAPTSTVMLPAKYTATLVDSSVSYGDTLEITWDPAAGSGNKMYISWEAECDGDLYYDSTIAAADDGDYSIDTSDMFVYSEISATNCDGTFTLERKRTGDLDSNYGKGGDIVGIQRRKLDFSVAF